MGRWGAVLVAAAVAGVAIPGSGATLLNLVGQGYEDVLVGISPQVDESQAGAVITALKETLIETSRVLFKATNHRLFIKRVKILVPNTWRSVTIDQAATTEVFEESHIRVDAMSSTYGDQVYTNQPGVCGEPGLYIHVTPKYLLDPAAPNVWGPRGKVLTQAWAKLRWGVFDEMGYPRDSLFPLFYKAYDKFERVTVKPNQCSDKPIKGRYVDSKTRGSCTFRNWSPNDDCRFEPYDTQAAVTSLMSFADLDNIEEMCNQSNSEKRHNSDAPNRHNLMCDSLSVWEVMLFHSDFNNTMRLPADHPVVPEVVVVQQQEAAFALVLDYSTSMMGVRIETLANTAKRWLLYDVADGSSVSIIKFSTSASVVSPLTVVTNSSRSTLAASVTIDTSGSTCIGCGLNTTLQELKNRTNKVIILITDGGENVDPRIADVMPSVIDSGARVVTISYGRSAEKTLETLAQNTGGKTYIVPENDDASTMSDAFQGSLTYQPNQSDSKIKIYEWEDVVQGKNSYSADFPVDSTVGRNLEFILNTDVPVGGPPSLTSPRGKTFVASTFNSAFNLWTIKLENTTAEVGQWTWTKPLQGGTVRMKVTVMAQARDSQVSPIVTKSWLSTGTGFVNAANQRVVVLASVTQGQNPVVGAKVRAYITTPNAAEAVELDLYDNGRNADTQANDGIYSRYFTQFLGIGRYGVKAQVWSSNDTFINGFISSHARRRRSIDTPHPRSRRSADAEKLTVYEPCCGSVVPVDRAATAPTGSFSRSAVAGSFNVVALPPSGDSFPPSKVLDVTIHGNLSHVYMSWTAPGDDLDTGTVSGYEIWMSQDPTVLKDNVTEESNATLLLDFATSSEMVQLLKEAGETVTFQLNNTEPLKQDTLYFFSLRAVDKAGNKSPMSRPTLHAFLTKIYGPDGIIVESSASTPAIGPWMAALLALVDASHMLAGLLGR